MGVVPPDLPSTSVDNYGNLRNVEAPKSNKGKEPVAEPTIKPTTPSRESSRHHPQIAKVENVSFAFINLPKGVRNLFYSKPINEFIGKRIDSEELLVKLPAVNFKTIHPNSFSCLATPGKIQELDNSQLGALTSECIANMSDQALESLTFHQAKFLLENKIECFDSSKKVGILIFKCSDSEYRPMIDTSKVQGVVTTLSFLENESFDEATQSQVQSIPLSVLQRNPNNIKALGAHISYLSPEQFKMITIEHIRAMTGSQAVEYVKQNIDQLSKEKIAVLLQKIPNHPELTTLRTKLVEKFYEASAESKNDLLKAMDLKYLPEGEIEKLPASFIRDAIQDGKTNHISPLLIAQIAVRNPNILGSLTKDEVLRLSKEQLWNIPRDHINNLPNKKYILAHSLTVPQLGGLSSNDFKEFIHSGVFQELAKDQINYVYSALVSTFGAEEIEKIPLEQLRWMSEMKPSRITGINHLIFTEISEAKILELYSLHSFMNLLQLKSLCKAISNLNLPEDQKEPMLTILSDKIGRMEPRK